MYAPGDTPQLFAVPFYGTKRCLYLHQWIKATTRLKSSMKRFDNFKWCSTNEDKSKGLSFFLGTYPELSLSDIILLDRVQKHLPIGADDCKRLKGMGLIEGRRPNVYLSFTAAAATDNKKQKAQYIKNRSFDDEHFREMILSYLDMYMIATKSEIVELLKDKLSDTLSDTQKVKKISNLIQDLRRSSKIESAGYSKWKRCKNAKHAVD